MKRIAKIIVKVLLHRGVITYDDIELYEYGIILLITTTIGAISMLAIAGLLFGFGIGVIQLLLFSALRVCSGGYHCKTYFSCFLVSNCIFVVNILFAARIRVLPCFYEVLVSFIIMIITSIYIIINAPVVNNSNPIKQTRREKNRNQAVQTTLVLLTFVIILELFFNNYEWASVISSNAVSAQFAVVVLMLLEKIKQKGELDNNA